VPAVQRDESGRPRWLPANDAPELREGMIQASTSSVQQAGQPSEVFTGKTDGVEYRVFQTVEVLEGKVS